MDKAAQTEPEEKLLLAGQLLDTYGGLLTERQRRFMRLHFEEDLSFSEIAREFKISRQAVHDSVKHAVHTLEAFEACLRLVARSRDERTAPPPAVPDRLRRLLDRVRASGELGTHPWLADELEALLGLLEGARIPEHV